MDVAGVLFRKIFMVLDFILNIFEAITGMFTGLEDNSGDKPSGSKKRLSRKRRRRKKSSRSR